MSEGNAAVEVTQADRDRAFSYWIYTRSLKADDYRAVTWRRDLDGGKKDSTETVQAFARHRLTTSDETAKLLDGLLASSGARGRYHAREYAAAYSRRYKLEPCRG
jgi:hypothetical protein